MSISSYKSITQIFKRFPSRSRSCSLYLSVFVVLYTFIPYGLVCVLYIYLHARAPFLSILSPPQSCQCSVRKILHISFLIHLKRITKYNAHTQLHNKIEIEYMVSREKLRMEGVWSGWMRIESFIFPHLYIPAAYFIYLVCCEFTINRSKETRAERERERATLQNLARAKCVSAVCVCEQENVNHRYWRGKEWTSENDENRVKIT